MTKQSIIREFLPGDENAIAAVWAVTGKAAHCYLDGWSTLRLEDAQTIIQRDLQRGLRFWVGVEAGHIVAFMSMQGSLIERLYVLPEHARKGWGSQLVDEAKRHFPKGLELLTHQANHPARKFYEKHGFLAVEYGVSPPPESAPDIKYEWKPRG